MTVGDRVEIASGLKAGWSIRAIAEHIGRCPSVVSREVRRNTTVTHGSVSYTHLTLPTNREV